MLRSFCLIENTFFRFFILHIKNRIYTFPFYVFYRFFACLGLKIRQISELCRFFLKVFHTFFPFKKVFHIYQHRQLFFSTSFHRGFYLFRKNVFFKKAMGLCTYLGITPLFLCSLHVSNYGKYNTCNHKQSKKQRHAFCKPACLFIVFHKALSLPCTNVFTSGSFWLRKI